MQRERETERGLSDSVSIALILLLVVIAAAIVFAVVFGYINLTPKSAYIAMRGIAANTSVGAATLTIFHFEGDPVNVNSSLTGAGVAPVSFNLVLPGGGSAPVAASPVLTDNTWRSGTTLSIYEDTAGYWVTNDINLRIAQAGTLGPLVNMQGGNYTINVVDEKAKVLIGAVPVTIAGIGITGPQYSPGLIATYYSDQGWATQAATNIAPRVYFADTASGSASDITDWPVALIGKADHFSVKYAGFIKIDTEDDYTFTLSSDDGSWMDLDATTNFISNGGDHSYASVSATKHLLPGYHPVTIRMYENGGAAVVYLTSKTPSMASPAVETRLWHIPSTAPTPDFTGAPLAGTPPLAVQFSDASIDATSYTWDFGDGTAVSHAKNPLHTYTAAGKFDVTLTSANSFGAATLKKNGYITAGTFTPGVIATYYSDQTWTTPVTTNIAPRIHFADTASGQASDISNWPSSYTGGLVDHFSVKYAGLLKIDTEDDYTFTLSSDDGSWMDLDTTTNFIANGGDHSYTSVSATKHLKPGFYPVTVRMYENAGAAVVYLDYKTPSMSSSQPVTQLYHVPSTPPVADFSATSHAGPAPLAVQFTDASTDATSWSWDFGDGSPADTTRNPSHTYTSTGTYDVRLTASNAFGSNTAVKSGFVTVGSFLPGITAQYYADQTWTSLVTTNTAGEIHFADTASGRASDVSNWPAAYTGGLVDHFSVKYTGLLKVDTEDDYTFTLSSDDGSWMDLDTTTNFIDNGGDHAYTSVSATRHLAPGYYPITVKMYENGGAAVVYLEYKTPSMASSQLVTNLWH